MTNILPRRIALVVGSLAILLFTAPVFSQLTDEIKLRAQRFVDSNESRLQNNSNLFERSSLLGHLAQADLAAGDAQKADKYARELLTVAEKIRANEHFDLSTPKYATHTSNIVLGLIALDGGDVKDAGDRLLASVNFTGTEPALSTFGPDMLLAKKLLELGERETVIKYLDACSSFWRLENGRLEKWKATIKQGQIPDFGANLLYGVDVWKVVQ